MRESPQISQTMSGESSRIVTTSKPSIPQTVSAKSQIIVKEKRTILQILSAQFAITKVISFAKFFAGPCSKYFQRDHDRD